MLCVIRTALLGGLALAIVSASDNYRIEPRLFCPAGFTRIGENCYSFIQDTTTSWYDAWQGCERINPRSVLVNFESEGEWKAIANYLRENGLSGKNWWIGGSDSNTESVWIWVGTGKVFTFKQWCGKEPDNAEGFENCAAIQGNTLCWRDVHCTHDKVLPNKNYICEYE